MDRFEHAPEWEAREPRPQRVVPGRLVRESALPEGRVLSQVFRCDDGYVLRFPGIADFEIAMDCAKVRSWPASERDDEAVVHLYLNQVLPLALGRSGHLVFHGSAVEIEGAAIAFVGESGRGKSTLAAAFATRGMRFLTDDGLVVRVRGAEGWVAPSHPSVRLWEDSRDAVIGNGIGPVLPVHWTSKGRFLAGDEMVFCDQPRRLLNVYFLGDGSACDVEIESLESAEAVIELVKHSLILDPEDRPPLAAHFDGVAMLVRGAACFRLDYPTDYGQIDQIVAAIAAHARATRGIE